MAAPRTIIRARIGADIRISLADLDPRAASDIRSYLTIANAPKQVAVDRGDWGAQDMPDSFPLWRHIGEDLVMPRGFALMLRAGLARFGTEVEWDDQTSTSWVPLADLAGMKQISLRPEQEVAAQELIRQRQGVLVADTGSGKTVIGLEVFRRSGLQCVVLVNSVGLAGQWRERASQHLGVEAGLVGDGSWEIKPLTIALLQSLHRRRDLDGFFSSFGMTILDEAHHIVAATYREVLDRCSTRMLIGKTATPLEGDWRRPLLESMIGPVVHRVKSETTKPEVLIVKTDFAWRPTGREKTLSDPRAIYRHVIKALEQDGDRVGLIARTISDQPERATQLVVSKRLDYLESISKALVDFGYHHRGEILMMRGSESQGQRLEIARRADDGGCVILSTVADEGIDIPRLDRIHLVWPARRSDTIVQQVGRVRRQHPEKLHPVVVDYVDVGNEMLRSQAYSRTNNVYRKKGWPMRHLREDS